MRTQPLCMLPLVRPGFLQRAPRHSAPPAVFPRTSSETRSRELVFPMNVGAPFNPYKVFQGAFAPYWILEHRGISAGAKLCYIRLLGFAGKDARCYPLLATLGTGLGVSDRQARDYVKELERAGLIIIDQRGLRKTNVYLFLWTQELAH